jgi:hypothetical protein
MNFPEKEKSLLSLSSDDVRPHFRNTDDLEQLRIAFNEVARLIPVLRKAFEFGKINQTSAFIHNWGMFQFCAGYILNSFMAVKDDLDANKNGAKVAKTAQKIWYAKWHSFLLATDESKFKHRSARDRHLVNLFQRMAEYVPFAARMLNADRNQLIDILTPKKLNQRDIDENVSRFHEDLPEDDLGALYKKFSVSKAPLGSRG